MLNYFQYHVLKNDFLVYVEITICGCYQYFDNHIEIAQDKRYKSLNMLCENII